MVAACRKLQSNPVPEKSPCSNLEHVAYDLAELLLKETEQMRVLDELKSAFFVQHNVVKMRRLTAMINHHVKKHGIHLHLDAAQGSRIDFELEIYGWLNDDLSILIKRLVV